MTTIPSAIAIPILSIRSAVPFRSGFLSTNTLPFLELTYMSVVSGTPGAGLNPGGIDL